MDKFILKHRFIIIGIIILKMLLLNIAKLNSQNLALNKPYTLSSNPNYSYTNPDKDRKLLTDGINSNPITPRMWRQETAVAWKGKAKLEITIDLGKSSPIEAISFNTAGGRGGVYFPKNIFIFISRDDVHYEMIGDAVSKTEVQYGVYEVKDFKLENINQKAQFVKLIVIPTNNLIICDEIKVIKGAESFVKPEIDNQNTIKPSDYIENYKYEEFSKENIEFLKDLVTKELVNQPQRSLKKKLNKLRLIEKEEEVGLFYNENILQNTYEEQLILSQYSPWESLNQLYFPRNNNQSLSYKYNLLTGQSVYGAFVVTNTENLPMPIRFDIINDTSVVEVEFFEAPHIPSLDGAMIIDPILPHKDSVWINPGFSKMFIYKITGLYPENTNIRIVLEGSSNLFVDINISVFNTSIQYNEKPLSVNVFSYLYQNLLTHVDPSVVANDLEDHYVNTIVVPPKFIPTSIMDYDFEKLISYLNNFEKIDNLILSYPFTSQVRKDGFKNGKFMSDEWKAIFITWYKKMVYEIQKRWKKDVEVYLFSYDEIRVEDMDDYERFILWVRNEMPQIKLYATLNRADNLERFSSMVDVVQTKPKLVDSTLTMNSKTEIWTYENVANGRAVNPYSYRLRAWEAFLNDVTGIGFWGYADAGGEMTYLDVNTYDFNPDRNFSVIYNSPDGSLVSSRRWEAFKRGLEDYEILKKYSYLTSNDKVKKEVKAVLRHSEDFELADITINKILAQIFR